VWKPFSNYRTLELGEFAGIEGDGIKFYGDDEDKTDDVEDVPIC
jgi:hypothetical protein